MIKTLRHALRSLRRSPMFSVTVVLTLGIGIGLNAAIFTVVDCVLIRPLGYHDADRIVGLQTHFVDENRSIARMGGDDYNDVARDVKGLEATAYYQSSPDGIRLNGEALYIPVAYVSPGFMKVMGVQAVAGRVFKADDKDAVDTLVSAGFAREHFGSAEAALGRTIQFEGTQRPIAGVLPDGFSFPGNTLVWMEEKVAPATSNRTAYNQRAIGKRAAGVSAAQLSAELATFSRQLQNAFPEDRFKTIEAVPLQEQLVGRIRPMLNLLMGSVSVILLLVCANITHLQLVRATQQLRSVTIRTALGASRSSLALRAFLEAVILAAAGCFAAVMLAVPALRLLVRIAPPDIPRLTDVTLNLDVLLSSFALSILLVGATAVLPLWRSWQIDPASALRQDSSRGMEDRGTSRLRNSFLVIEVALTLTLSVAAVLLTRQLIQQSRQSLGFEADHLITLDSHIIDNNPIPADLKNPTPAQQAELSARQAAIRLGRLARLGETLQFLSSVPGVESAAAIDGAPMGFGGSNVGYAVKGRQVFAPPFKGLPNAEIRPVTPDVFSVMQVPLVRGRALAADDRLGSPTVLLINQELARQIFPGQDPVGQQIMCGYDEKAGWWTIVGVVGNIRSDSAAAAPTPTFYVPVAQHPSRASDMQLVVRTRTNPAAMLDTLSNSLKQSHPEIAVKATTMRENIGDTQRADNFRTLLFGSFAAVSVLLAAVGMYGVTAYSVAQRRFEFGLRVALGAERMQVLGMVLGKSLALACLGIVIGIALSVSLVRVLGSLLGKMPATDFAGFAIASLGVLGIALLATLLPARAAANVDPMSVLRSE